MRTIFVAALSALVATACNGTTAPVDENYTALPADQVAFGVAYVTTDNGVRRANLRADTTLMYNDSSLIDLHGVELDMYDENGAHQATLTSLSGQLNRSTNMMIARGAAECDFTTGEGCVVLTVRGAQGSTIWTQELHYDPAQKRIWSDVRTRRRLANGQIVQGQSFTADDQFRSINIRGLSGSGLEFDF